MVTLVHDHPEEIRSWVSNELGMGKIGGDMFHAIGMINGDKLIGGIVYHDYLGHSISCSLATTSKAWCNRRVLSELFGYPFITCGAIRFQAFCRRSNKAMKKFFIKSGFKFEGVARKGFDGKEDAFLYSMLRNECKWLRNTNNG